ncbi:MAG: ABC transporter permease subunit [Anaerolineae bacterium]|nr:ABC transporter permease subunit [Anaerolineae bacterium]
MADISLQQDVNHPETSGLSLRQMRRYAPAALLAVVILLAVWLGVAFRALTDDNPAFIDSTVGELAVWMAGQSEEEAPESLLGQYARNWALQAGETPLPEPVLFTAMRNMVAVWCWLVAATGFAGLAGVLLQTSWSRAVLLLTLLGFDLLLFVIPAAAADLFGVTLGAIALMLVILLIVPGRISRILGFFVVLSTLLLFWEVAKSFAESINYKVTVPQGAWTYESYPTLEDALVALESGDIDAVIYDRKDLGELMLSDDPDEVHDMTPFPDLTLLTNITPEERRFGLPIQPSFSGRLGVAVRSDGAEQWGSTADFLNQPVGTVAREYADEKYLAVPRDLVLVDLKIFNNLNLPHLQDIAEAFLQPARRNGPLLLTRILGDAALYTWGEALYGFILGASLGFVLGALFAHSSLMERGLLPYVVASQTVPILAIAPMVVIWLGAGPIAVSVISAYITFFPVTINTLRGLRSPSPMALELMRSYAASSWAIMWKLRFPSSLPYVFTALKVSATASVVGAIIGELPSSIRDGLGRAILDFSSDYSLVSTPKLWAAIIMAALVGITFFVIVSLIERLVLHGYVRDA